jgi:hypothetical protein
MNLKEVYLVSCWNFWNWLLLKQLIREYGGDSETNDVLRILMKKNPVLYNRLWKVLNQAVFNSPVVALLAAPRSE